MWGDGAGRRGAARGGAGRRGACYAIIRSESHSSAAHEWVGLFVVQLPDRERKAAAPVQRQSPPGPLQLLLMPLQLQAGWLRGRRRPLREL